MLLLSAEALPPEVDDEDDAPTMAADSLRKAAAVEATSMVSLLEASGCDRTFVIRVSTYHQLISSSRTFMRRQLDHIRVGGIEDADGVHRNDNVAHLEALVLGRGACAEERKSKQTVLELLSLDVAC